MYSIVLLAALTASPESAGIRHKGLPTPLHADPTMGGPFGYAGGYNWPGYACWGGCGGYAGPAYGYPLTPVVSPAPCIPFVPDIEDEPEADEKADRPRGDDARDSKGSKGSRDTKDSKDSKDSKDEKKDKGADDSKNKLKKPPKIEDDEDKLSAHITLLLPPGVKLLIDGREVEAAEEKTLITQPLKKGYIYTYNISLAQPGQVEPMQTRKVKVRAGSSIREDFRFGVQTLPAQNAPALNAPLQNAPAINAVPASK